MRWPGKHLFVQHQHLSDATLLDERIRLERIHTSIGVVGAMAAALVIFAVHPHNSPAWPLLPWWLIPQWVLGCGWLGFVAQHHRYPEQFRQLWPYASTLTSSLFGLAWGVGRQVLVDGLQADHDTLYMIIYIGVTTGGFIATAFHLPSMIAFGVSCLLPVLWGALLQPSLFERWLNISTVVYTLAFFAFTLNLHFFLLDALERREREISLAKRLEEEKRQTERAHQEKNRFLAAASHDLRQPLQAIHFFQYALDKKLHETDARELFGKLQESTQSLTDLLNSLLDISKLDAGGIEIQKQPVFAHELLRRVYERYFPLAATAGILLSYQPVRVWLYTDPKQLERMIQNFVVNAIKHMGRQGRIVLGGRRQGKVLRIEVHDNGVGIPAAAQQAIFTEFYQLNNPERNRQKGLGLGLAIVKRLAGLLGHEVGLASHEGRGSLFAITVPLLDRQLLPVIAMPADWEQLPPQLLGKVLLVEDDQTVLTSLEMLFRLWHYPAVSATTLNPAAILQQHADLHLIVSDYQLQDGHNGLQLIQQLRMLSGREIPAILITGNTSPDVLTAISQAGVTVSYKPINPRTLRLLVDKALTSATRQVS